MLQEAVYADLSFHVAGRNKGRSHALKCQKLLEHFISVQEHPYKFNKLSWQSLSFSSRSEASCWRERGRERGREVMRDKARS